MVERYSEAGKPSAGELVALYSWEAQRIDEYWLSLSQGDNALLPQSVYPHIVEVSQNWHEVLNRMREETADGYERCGPIGFSSAKDRLYPARVNLTGTDSHISEHQLWEYGQQVRQEGIVGMIGDVHSHYRPQEEYGAIAFSASDLCALLRPKGYPPLMMGLIAGNMNMFAFATADTLRAVVPFEISQVVFQQYWKTQFPLAGRSDREALPMNKAIAAQHFLVLYEGEMNQPLRQRYPLDIIG